MSTQRKVFRIEAFVRTAPMQGPAQGEAPRLLQSVTRELDAVVSEAAQSTRQMFSAAAEVIDQAALMMASNSGGPHGPHAAANIRGSTARIYEACGFHDIVGQRVAEILDALEGLEDRPLVRASSRGLIHGPRLHGDAGHATQDDIDAILARKGA